MDTELLEQHRGGSEAAFADIVRRHTPWIYALARRGCGDAHLAEDVVQAVFILLHRKAPRFSGDGAMINWLHKVTRYAAATAARSERRRRKHQTEAAMQPPQSPPGDCWQELAPLLDRLIDWLPREDRQAVLLRYYLDMNFAEVGKEMDCSAETARKRVDRAVDKLRGFAERRGIVLSSVFLTSALLEQVRILPPAGLVARATTVSSAGSALAISSQPIVKGTILMMTIKTMTTAACTLAVCAVLGGAIWVAKAAGPTMPPRMAVQNPQRYPKLSPFSAIRWVPQVRVDGTWYDLLAIDDQPIQEILDFTAKTYGATEIEKRIDEDLVEVLTRKGYPPDATVKLRLRTLDTQKVVTLESVPMTAANRNAIWRARNAIK